MKLRDNMLLEIFPEGEQGDGTSSSFCFSVQVKLGEASS